MEDLSNEEWHRQALEVRARLAVKMAEKAANCLILEGLYRQLETDRAEHDRFEEVEVKFSRNVG